MSACLMGTITEVEPELFSGFGSGVADEMVAVFVKVVPSGVASGMWPTKVKSALDPLVKRARVQVIVPLVPGVGWLLQSKAGPVFWFADTNVIPGGSGSLRETVAASSVPKLKTVTANDTSVPFAALDGPLFVAAGSAPGCARAEGTSPRKATLTARERTIVRCFTTLDYSNLSSTVYSRPCDVATAS